MARILIVEDEDRIAAFLAKGLSADGHQVSTVADGLEDPAIGAHAARRVAGPEWQPVQLHPGGVLARVRHLTIRTGRSVR